MNTQEGITRLTEKFYKRGALLKEDLIEFSKVLDEIGWPKISTVGAKAASAFWVLAIEGLDPKSELYRRCWDLIKDCKEMQLHRAYYNEFKSKL